MNSTGRWRASDALPKEFIADRPEKRAVRATLRHLRACWGCKPNPQKIPSPYLQPSNDGIEIDNLPVTAKCVSARSDGCGARPPATSS
jgi:hypothetical protein